MERPGNARVVITGIKGFTGRHLAHALRDDGWEVFGLGRVSAGSASDGEDIDLGETDSLAEWLGHVRPTHVVHLAAQAHVMQDPVGFYKVNVLGTESLLTAIERAQLVPAKVLLASSANVYGNVAVSPINEDTPFRPVNHYGLSKVAMELLAQNWFGKFPIVVVRPFNYTGPGQSESFLFPKIVGAFFRKEARIRMGNLDVSRDISEVSFVCEAYRRLLLSPGESMALNICSGRSVPIAQAIQAMSDIAGYSPDIEVDPALVRTSEIRDLCGDPARLFDQIGPLEPWPLERILLRMYRQLGNASIAK